MNSLHPLFYDFTCRFLNSCANPVALYCVSGVFRQYFHKYLCCKPVPPPNRMGQSTATGVCDTSFTSTLRRNTINSHHKSSQNQNNNNSCSKTNLNNNSNGNNSSYWHQNSGYGGGGVGTGGSGNGERKDSVSSQSIIGIEKR